MSDDTFRDSVKRGNLPPEYARRECCWYGRFVVRLLLATVVGVLGIALIIEVVSLIHRALT